MFAHYFVYSPDAYPDICLKVCDPPARSLIRYGRNMAFTNKSIHHSSTPELMIKHYTEDVASGVCTC
jgi:hypothetical protein